MKLLLQVDDNLALRQPPAGIPEREESAVQAAATGAEATSLDHQQSTELVILELTMPEQACLEPLLQLRGTDATRANTFESQETLDAIALLAPTTKQSA